MDWVTRYGSYLDAATLLSQIDMEKVQRLHHWVLQYKSIKIFMGKWKSVKYPKELSDLLEVTKYGDIRHKSDKILVPQYIDPRGYKVIYLNNKEYKAHRLVAGTFCGKLTDNLEVHHINEDRQNNWWGNLLICTHAEHVRIHHKTTTSDVVYEKIYKGEPILTEDQVHDICKLLENGLSYPKIREKLHLYNVSDDAIGKIAKGKNWLHISSLYDIKTEKRATMDSYTPYAKQIGIMMYNGMKINDIARRLNIPITNKTEYDRLFKCAKRYKKQFIEGKWGSLDEFKLGKG